MFTGPEVSSPETDCVTQFSAKVKIHRYRPLPLDIIKPKT